jgi:hypothetical protein
MDQDPQIGGYLRPAEKELFDAYIEQFKLRPGAVATLLILRELRCARLLVLNDRYPMPPGKGRSRVSARPTDISIKRAFEQHVATIGLDPDPAAGVIWRAEIHERWLERALLMESA